MLGIENFFVFFTTGILLNLYLGPDSLYIIGRSVSQGRLAGVWAVFGIVTGAFPYAPLLPGSKVLGAQESGIPV